MDTTKKLKAPLDTIILSIPILSFKLHGNGRHPNPRYKLNERVELRIRSTMNCATTTACLLLQIYQIV